MAPACKHFLEDLLEDYFDEKLTALARLEFDRHSAACSRCRMLRDTLRKTLQFYKKMTARPVPSDVQARLMEALEKRMAVKRPAHF